MCEGVVHVGMAIGGSPQAVASGPNLSGAVSLRTSLPTGKTNGYDQLSLGSASADKAPRRRASAIFEMRDARPSG